MKTARGKDGKYYTEVESIGDLKRIYPHVLKERSDFFRAYHWACELYPFFVQRTIEVLGAAGLKWFFSISELKLLFDRSGDNAAAQLEARYGFKNSIGEKRSKEKEYSFSDLSTAYAIKQGYPVKAISDLIKSRGLLNLEEAADYVCLEAPYLLKCEQVGEIVADLPGIRAYSRERLDSLVERLRGKIVLRLDAEYYGEERPGKIFMYRKSGSGIFDPDGTWIRPVLTSVAEGNDPIAFVEADVVAEPIAYLSNNVVHSFIAIFAKREEGEAEVNGILRRGGYSLQRWVLYPGDPHYRGFSRD
jgi:hypothetical protein